MQFLQEGSAPAIGAAARVARVPVGVPVPRAGEEAAARERAEAPAGRDGEEAAGEAEGDEDDDHDHFVA